MLVLGGTSDVHRASIEGLMDEVEKDGAMFSVFSFTGSDSDRARKYEFMMA